MKLAILIMHCPVIPGRPEAYERLCEQLESPDDNVYTVVDEDRAGAWPTARNCWEIGIDLPRVGNEYVIVLNDDAWVSKGFADAALAALEAANTRSPRDPVCFYTANERAAEAHAKGAAFYSTPDGLVGVGCGMHRENVKEFLAWHDANFVGEHTDDGRINLWAMATGRRILTTLPSLVGHQLPDESTQGNERDSFRTPAVPPPDDVTGLDPLRWEADPIARFGRQYVGNHWRLLTNVAPHAWKAGKLVEAAYELERQR